MRLLWLVVILPLIEIALFAEVGSLIGTLPTLLLVIVSTTAGFALLRSEGETALSRTRLVLNAKESGTGGWNSVARIVAALLLIVPGFFTDIVAIVVLIPWTRRQLGRWMFSEVAGQTARQHATSEPGSANTQIIIDGDFRRVDEPTASPPSQSLTDRREDRF